MSQEEEQGADYPMMIIPIIIELALVAYYNDKAVVAAIIMCVSTLVIDIIAGKLIYDLSKSQHSNSDLVYTFAPWAAVNAVVCVFSNLWFKEHWFFILTLLPVTTIISAIGGVVANHCYRHLRARC